MHVLKAIKVIYLPATDKKPERLKAFSGTNSLIIRYNNKVHEALQAQQAAQALIKQMQWDVEISGLGRLPDEGYAITLKGVMNVGKVKMFTDFRDEVTEFDCDDCGQNCDEVNQHDEGNTFVCTQCHFKREDKPNDK